MKNKNDSRDKKQNGRKNKKRRREISKIKATTINGKK